MGLDTFGKSEREKPGDLSEDEKSLHSAEESISKAKALAERVREFAKSPHEHPSEQYVFQELAADIEADIANIQREKADPTNATSLELAQEELAGHMKDAYLLLREPPPPMKNAVAFDPQSLN